MKIVTIIILLFISKSSISQLYVFDTIFPVLNVYKDYYNKGQEGRYIRREITETTDVYTKSTDTTYFKEFNRSGQLEFAASQMIGSVLEYRCWISYNKNEDMLWRSDDTVILEHHFYLDFVLPKNKITCLPNKSIIRFEADTSRIKRVKTTLFFSKNRSVITIEYKDLNKKDNSTFRKVFIRKGDYFILKNGN